MRQLVLFAAVGAALLSGCGQCTAVCFNTATLTAIDSTGNVLTLQSVSENRALSPTAGCGTNATINESATTVSSSCTAFAIDAVATNGKRFSGILDVSSGSRGATVCGSVCRAGAVTITLN